jgi:hypothetical protein
MIQSIITMLTIAQSIAVIALSILAIIAFSDLLKLFKNK